MNRQLLIILFILIVLVAFLYRDVKFVAYLIGILEIFCRLIHYLGDNLPISGFNGFINRNVPSSLFSIIDKYTTGPVNVIISWILVVFIGLFLFYLIRYFFKKK